MIISISHTKGGVGKSTLAFNLAYVLSLSSEVEILDLDYQKTLTYINQYRKEPFNIKSFENIDELKKYFLLDHSKKTIIIDVGGFDSDTNRLAMIMSDIIITPVSDSSTELLGLSKFAKTLNKISKVLEENIVARVVLNQISPQKSKLDELKKHINNYENFTLFDTILRTRADYGKAIDDGKSVNEFLPDSKASIEFNAFVDEIKKIIEEVQ